jgi:hypothetical protein
MKLARLFCVVLLLSSCQKEISQDQEYATLGHSSKDFLTSTKYTSLIVEINYMPGFEPDALTLSSFQTFLATYLNKPEGILLRKNAIPASGKERLSTTDLAQLEKAHRTAFTYGSTITVHVLITDAAYSDDETFATSYWNTSFALFGKTIAANAGGVGEISRQQLLATLMEHEAGHLLGLVDQGSPMQQPHKDVANGAHCSNRSCLMYYAIETDASLAPTIPALDATCRADLKAAGGK